MLGTMGQVCHRESKQPGQEFGQAKEKGGVGVAFLEFRVQRQAVDAKLTTQGELHTHPLSAQRSLDGWLHCRPGSAHTGSGQVILCRGSS